MNRDYRLVGPEHALAEAKGLVSAEWYQCPIPRKRLKELMARSDFPAIRDTLLWFALLGLSGWLGHRYWGTWWAVPAFAVYGVLYGTVGDSRWHEGGHGTAFKTSWMNTVVYHLGSFMVIREPVSWRWSHARHHSDTIIVGRDPEIAFKRPPSLPKIVFGFTGIDAAYAEFRKIAVNCIGRLTDEEADFVPESERGKAIFAGRVYALIFAGVIVWSVAARTIEPLMFIGLPTLYGKWLSVIFGITQHAGLAEDVLDHRLNCRTVRMNPVLRFLYWNMNYHVEHHMFPTVPYHALPALHAEVKADMPPPYTSLVDAYREIIPALVRQSKDITYFVSRPLPAPVAVAGAQ